MTRAENFFSLLPGNSFIQSLYKEKQGGIAEAEVIRPAASRSHGFGSSKPIGRDNDGRDRQRKRGGRKAFEILKALLDATVDEMGSGTGL